MSLFYNAKGENAESGKKNQTSVRLTEVKSDVNMVNDHHNG